MRKAYAKTAIVHIVNTHIIIYISNYLRRNRGSCRCWDYPSCIQFKFKALSFY